MDIPNINNNSLNPQNKADKASQGEKSAKTDAAGNSKNVKQSSSIQSDELSISKSANEGELKFALAEYQKLQKQSVESLREIKQNIDNGVYEQDKIQSQVSDRIQGEISAVEAIEHQGETQKTNTELTPELKDRLLNDESVLDQISQKLIDDLSRL